MLFNLFSLNRYEETKKAKVHEALLAQLPRRHEGTKEHEEAGRRKGLILGLLILFGFSCLLAGLSYFPILRMRETNQFVFWGSKGFYEDTFMSLTNALMYGSAYFKESPVQVFRIGVLVLLGAIGVCSFMEVMRWVRAGQTANKFAYTIVTATEVACTSGGMMVFSFVLLVGTVVVNILQYYIVHTPYLQTRTALLFFPLGALPIALMGRILLERKRKLFYIFALFLGLPLGYHLFNSLNLKSSWEWWYDADTKNILRDLKKIYDLDPEKKRITLGTNAVMQPSFWFHVTEEGRESWIVAPEWISTVHGGAGIEYYYTFPSDLDGLKGEYEKIGDYGGRMLMKRKK